MKIYRKLPYSPTPFTNIAHTFKPIASKANLFLDRLNHFYSSWEWAISRPTTLLDWNTALLVRSFWVRKEGGWVNFDLNSQIGNLIHGLSLIIFRSLLTVTSFAINSIEWFHQTIELHHSHKGMWFRHIEDWVSKCSVGWRRRDGRILLLLSNSPLYNCVENII